MCKPLRANAGVKPECFPSIDCVPWAASSQHQPEWHSLGRAEQLPLNMSLNKSIKAVGLAGDNSNRNDSNI
ncbi:MAG: hypothetical protein D6742_19055 [Cyanobacteria bacterium J069]|nr:MAG: hypothetical protein D6742_19055 [Cyanobacteria bacterium J069]